MADLGFSYRLVFYYPFTALTSLFFHIVANPSEESVREDIALMEIVIGFFGRLEYITSGEAAFTKTTEFVRQARNVVANASINHVFPQRSDSDPDYDLIADLPAECVAQGNSEPTMDGSPVSPATSNGAFLGIGTENPIPNLVPPGPVSVEAHCLTPKELATHLHGLDQHNPAVLFSLNHNRASNLRSEEILDDSWLEDFM